MAKILHMQAQTTGGSYIPTRPESGLIMTDCTRSNLSSLSFNPNNWSGVANIFRCKPKYIYNYNCGTDVAFVCDAGTSASGQNYRIGLFEYTSTTAAKCLALTQELTTTGSGSSMLLIKVPSYDGNNISYSPSKTYGIALFLNQYNTGDIVFTGSLATGTEAQHITNPSSIQSSNPNADYATVGFGSWTSTYIPDWYISPWSSNYTEILP